MTAYTAPTVVLPPPEERSFWTRAASSEPPLAEPTEKVKAPWTGCESADVTRHVTI